MWAIEVSRQTTASKEQIRKLWTDVPNWNTWDSTVVSSRLYGDFKPGTKGVVRLAGGPKSKFIIKDSGPMVPFSNRSYLPLCEVDFVVKLTETRNGLLVIYRQEMTGFLTFLFSRIMGEMMEKGLNKGIEDLIAKAEKSN